MKLLLNPIIHEGFDLLRYIGLRDRLRCPQCKAVGTWKPHGASADQRDGDRPVRRWMCKWCGLYYGPEGSPKAWPDSEAGYWVIDAEQRQDTPSEALAKLMPTWPWRG